MKTGALGPPHKRVWAQFHKSALFELETHKVSERIVCLTALQRALKCRANAKNTSKHLAA
jgi:hypothetical protein